MMWSIDTKKVALRQDSLHVKFMPEVFRVELCRKGRISIMLLWSSAQSQESIVAPLQTRFSITLIYGAASHKFCCLKVEKLGYQDGGTMCITKDLQITIHTGT